MLILFAPVGIFFMWKYKHHGTILRSIATIVFGIGFLITAFGENTETTDAENDNASSEETEESNGEQQVNATVDEAEEQEEQDNLEEITFEIDESITFEDDKVIVSGTTNLADGAIVTLEVSHIEDFEYMDDAAFEVKDGQFNGEIDVSEYPEGEIHAFLGTAVFDLPDGAYGDEYGKDYVFVGDKVNSNIETDFLIYTATADFEKTLSLEEKKANAKTMEYGQLEKNPDRHKGEYVTFTGEILEIGEDSGYTIMRIAVDDWYEDILWVEQEGYNDFISGDIVTIYGEVFGSVSYTSQAGWDITIPGIMADIVE